MQNRTICANPSTDAVDARAIQNSKLLRMVEEASSCQPSRKQKLKAVCQRPQGNFAL
jgi:hypothetical protein